MYAQTYFCPHCRSYFNYPAGFQEFRQYPETDPQLFVQSAQEFKSLLTDASEILDELAESEDFAKKIMSAAQKNNKQEVQHLIDSIGVDSDVKIDYNPDNLNLKMSSQVEDTECCQLEMAIRWRRFP
ncbi:hypothetical protein ACFO3D_09385 [Virgibacillus kekensis]|uniref:Uncharacterized protein n=1 Tax=Virgibacillus kekensis TaxID=202261 RepID=A0ABV9DKU9_9BACI